MSTHTFAARVDSLCVAAARDLPSEWSDSFEAIRRRLNGPMRIAIAGRVKAGKSTLLNALIGERLAPTDAGECTRIVTWYRYATAYEVMAQASDGVRLAPRFRKGESALEIDLPADEAVEHLEIGWPARSLVETSYIDTPGLGSLTPAVTAATLSFLGVEERAPSQADAVVYLMRHAHMEDVQFLEGFRDAGLPTGSPVNTVAVLSRADEIGAGRLDALDSARTIARRYMADERLRCLAGEMVPLAGLLAETGATLEELEFACLRQLAFEAPEIDDLLLSVDRFRNPERNPLAGELRERVLARFGLFGIRLSVAALQQGQVATSQDLARLLLAQSGIQELRRIIQTRFTSRARLLVARSALLELRALAASLRETNPSAAARLEGALEEVTMSAHEVAELDLLHAIGVGAVRLSDDERIEAERLTGEVSDAARLGLGADTPTPAQEQAALGAVERWRQRGAHPLTDRDTARACEIMARSYEGLYARLRQVTQG